VVVQLVPNQISQNAVALRFMSLEIPFPNLIGWEIELCYALQEWFTCNIKGLVEATLADNRGLADKAIAPSFSTIQRHYFVPKARARCFME
jgi:hypothetical protein